MKKLCAALLIFCILLGCVACASSSTDTAPLESEIAALKSENEQLKQENKELKKQINSINDNTETEVPAEDADTPTEVFLNKTFTVDGICEITLTDAEWCEKILPSDTSGGYSYIPEQDGEKYFVVHGEIKNLSSQSFNILDFSHESEMLINDKYKAQVHMEAESPDGEGFYGQPIPLQTLPIVVYASVSDELYDLCENMQITLNIVNTEDDLNNYFDMDMSHDSFVISFSK